MKLVDPNGLVVRKFAEEPLGSTLIEFQGWHRRRRFCDELEVGRRRRGKDNGLFFCSRSSLLSPVDVWGAKTIIFYNLSPAF